MTLAGDRAGERGSVAMVVALALTPLLGFAALVVDVGLSWAVRTEAQTAADPAALARPPGWRPARPRRSRRCAGTSMPTCRAWPPDLPGLAVLDHAAVRGTGITLYLTCSTCPTPCPIFGAGSTLTCSATARTTGPYANLAVFSDRTNPRPW